MGFILVFSLLYLVFSTAVRAEECSQLTSCSDLIDCEKKSSECQKAIESMKQAKQPHEETLRKMDSQISGFQLRIKQLEKEILNKEAAIKKDENNLSYQEELLSKRVREFYIKSSYQNLLAVVFSQKSMGQILGEIAYQQTATNQGKQNISEIVLRIKDLEERKKKQESEKQGLAALRLATDKQAESVRKLLREANAYLEKVESVFSSLQQQILSIKSGGFTASVGDSELADDYNASIKGFRESAQAGYFAVFSFGAYTHRKGMSQYGARGRAQNGQNYKDILKAYYGKDVVSKDTGGSISVSGFGNLDFETTYLYGIAEMPSSWHSEALKAQAVAARTYAYRSKQNGSTICTNEACQVFSMSKANNSPESWRKAVNDTRGQVLEDVVTYYSSTTGGYINTIGWDTTDHSGGSNFFDKSYEKIGGSPWAYKAWYTKGYDINSDKCGRSNPWLSGADLADIVNAALLLRNRNDNRVTPITTNCWGGNPYSFDELRNQASGGIGNVDSVSVIQGDGITSEVVINGSLRLTGSEFKKAFNLRAPGYLKIPQDGFAFFNIEKK